LKPSVVRRCAAESSSAAMPPPVVIIIVDATNLRKINLWTLHQTQTQ
jgi:hypothetical protein